MRIPLVGGAYQGISKAGNAQTCINLYPQPDPSEPAEGLLIETPGHGSRFDDDSLSITSPVKAIIHPGGAIMGAVIGQKWVEVSKAGATTDRSNSDLIGALDGIVNLATSGYSGAANWVVIADGAELFTSTSTSSTLGNLTPVTSPITFKSNTVTYLDGRFVCDDQNNRDNFYYTGYGDVTWVEFAFAPDHGDWDDVLGVNSVDRKLFVFGQHHVGVWYDTGGATVFQRYQDGYSDVGCAAINTARAFNGSMMWLAGDEHGQGYVVAWGGAGEPQMVSTPQINERLMAWRATMEESFAYVMSWRGHDWYVLTNNTADETFVFDGLSQQWFQWSSGLTGGRHFSNCHTFGMSSSKQFTGFHYFGTSASTGEIFKMDSNSDTYDEDGDVIRRERTTVHFAQEESRVNISQVQLDMQEATARAKTALVTTTTDAAEAKGQTVISVTATTQDVAGTHTGSNNVTIMTDSSKAFVTDEHVTRTITNTTDGGSSGAITSNTDQVVNVVLTGGTDQDWDTNDAYTIATPAEAGHQVAITMDNGLVHEAAVTAVSAGVSITIGEPLPFAAASGAVVVIYENTGVTLEVSKDAGLTFGNKRWVSVGVSGETKTRALWRKLGWGRNWVFRFGFQNFNGKVRLKGLIAKVAGEK